MSFASFQQLVNNKFKFNLFLLSKLPSAWLCGVRVREIDAKYAVVSVPYKWLSQNPFRSIYFACQAMAAEMSTGLLAMGHIYKSDPSVSMLVTRLEAVFIKKATDRIYFTCTDGDTILNAVTKAIETGEGQVITAHSIGRNAAGEIVGEFKIEWSFKVKGIK